MYYVRTLFLGAVFPDGSVDTISISASLAALSDELESGGFSITETNWNRSHLVQKLVPFIKRICRVKNCSDVSINPILPKNLRLWRKL